MTKIKAQRMLRHDDLVSAGQFIYFANHGESGHGGMVYVCPCGCGIEGVLRFRVGENKDSHPTWVWDGNEESPTLVPSILRTVGCKWHGYLTNGEFIEC